VPVDERLIQVGPYSPDVPLAPTRALLEAEDRPTAIFASSDVSGLAAMALAAQLGLNVPADLSLVGFDNIPESALSSPPLTTISQPIRQMGQRAIDLLVKLIQGEAPKATHITLATTLVVRQSTCEPKE
jgi:LacI family transcriptional regulator